jgi:hypothetical protein
MASQDVVGLGFLPLRGGGSWFDSGTADCGYGAASHVGACCGGVGSGPVWHGEVFLWSAIVARPSRPMYAPRADGLTHGVVDDCADGAMSLDDAALFCGICKREIERAVSRGELETFYHGTKPLVPKRLLVAWLAKKLEASRAERRPEHAV